MSIGWGYHGKVKSKIERLTDMRNDARVSGEKGVAWSIDKKIKSEMTRTREPKTKSAYVDMGVVRSLSLNPSASRCYFALCALGARDNAVLTDKIELGSESGIYEGYRVVASVSKLRELGYLDMNRTVINGSTMAIKLHVTNMSTNNVRVPMDPVRDLKEWPGAIRCYAALFALGAEGKWVKLTIADIGKEAAVTNESNVSKHLKILADKGFVCRHKRSTVPASISYRLVTSKSPCTESSVRST